MSDYDAVLSVQKITPGQADRFRERFDRTPEEKEAMYDQLREEGITTESVFIESREDGDYLLYYIEAEDYDRMLEEFRESDEDWAEDYRRFLDETIVGGAESYHEDRPERIFHISVPDDEDDA